MRHTIVRYVVLFAAALTVAIPAQAAQVNRCADVQETRRGESWADALMAFQAEHRTLSDEQLRWLEDALVLAPGLNSTGDELSQALHRARGLNSRAEALFTRDELGDLFSRLGSMQSWLVEMGALALPYCACTPVGAPCPPPYPAGSVCHAISCVTWTDGAGSYHIGLCGPASTTSNDRVPSHPNRP